jgi:hypothetical protein
MFQADNESDFEDWTEAMSVLIDKMAQKTAGVTVDGLQEGKRTRGRFKKYLFGGTKKCR